ncbi:MAG: cell division protein FtsA [Chloroflexota bacterium]|nr:cell division protein FtsA [Chloroflexota bacterium]
MNRTVVGIDVGTTKICTMVAEVRDDGRVNILGRGLTPSKGLDKGVVVNIDEAVAAISTSVEKAERTSGYRIGTAYVGIAGRHISSLNQTGVVAISRADHEITRQDVDRAVESAQAVAIPTQREVIHVIPRAYIVDGHENIRDPIGMSGYRLEVETHIVTAEAMAVQNLIRSVERAGVVIDDLVLQPLASAEAVLSPEDKDRGVVLVDIGGGTTDVAIFIQGGIWHSVVLPLGGNQLTNDIVYVLHTPHDTAEYLKLKYGQAIAREPEEGEDDEIDTESFAPGERQQISRFYLNQIIQARVEQIIDLVGAEIRRSGYEGLLPAGVVLTGGSALLSGIDELARDMLKVPVRIGVPTNLSGLAESVDAPPFATSIGLVRWGMTKGMRHPGGSYTSRSESNNWRNVYDRFKLWLREFLP